MTTNERIEANANLIKWCVHILGPDEVLAAPSHAAAVQRADELNRSIHERDHEPDDLLTFAYAAPWSYDDKSHGDELGKWDE